MRLLIAALGLVLLAAAPARAEVTSSGPSQFVIQAEADVAASPQQTWRRLLQIERWWNSQHTYSGDAANLHLAPIAGGCWCERWGNQQSVEHAHVVSVLEYEGVRTLRVLGGFGPLQEMGVNGAMTYTVAPHASGAKITVTYRVSGDSSLGLDQLAPLVDGVLMEQFARLSRYSATGSPE